MPFRLKKGINHSPGWYEKHMSENEAAPVSKKMLRHDMDRIAANFDTGLTYEENISNYRERWDSLLKTGGRIGGPAAGAELVAEMERREEAELGKGFLAALEYESEPFSTIGKLMDDHALSEDTISEFLKWRARKRAAEKRRAARRKLSREQAKQEAVRQKLRQRFFKFRGEA